LSTRRNSGKSQRTTRQTYPPDTPYHPLPPGNTEQQLIVSPARIRKEVGYQEAIPVDEAIRRTTGWETQNPPGVSPQQFDYAAEDATLAEAA